MTDLNHHQPTCGDWIRVRAGTTDVLNDADGSAHDPRGRMSAATWCDSTGKLWLFGGSRSGNDETNAVLGDLWYYDQTGSAWVSIVKAPAPGDTQINAISPGPRGFAAAWSDRSHSLWLFGGSPPGPGVLGDFWKFSNATRTWTVVAELPVNPEVKSTGSDYPSARWGAAFWTDSARNFWLFGGQQSRSAPNDAEMRSDLWCYDRVRSEWVLQADGVWSNADRALPSPRLVPSTCSTGDELWLFGGLAPIQRRAEWLRDCWKFNTRTAEFRRVDMQSNEHWPAAREGAAMFADLNGNIYLFGGRAGNVMNDLWKFDISQSIWIRMAVTHSAQVGAYPTARTSASSWIDDNGDFWMFGGYGVSVDGDVRMLNDLWTYKWPTPDTRSKFDNYSTNP